MLGAAKACLLPELADKPLPCPAALSKDELPGLIITCKSRGKLPPACAGRTAQMPTEGGQALTGRQEAAEEGLLCWVPFARVCIVFAGC